MKHLPLLLLLSGPVLAHQHGEPFADWYKSLRQPLTGMSCCSHEGANRDCFPTDNWKELAGGRFVVLINGEWHPVPAEKVVERENPTGHAVLCNKGVNIYCFVPIGAGA